MGAAQTVYFSLKEHLHESIEQGLRQRVMDVVECSIDASGQGSSGGIGERYERLLPIARKALEGAGELPENFGGVELKSLISEAVAGNGPAVEWKDPELFHPLHNAAMYANLGDGEKQDERLGIISYLHSKGADIEARDRHQWTPVYWTANKGNLRAMKHLESLEANLDPHPRDQYGMSPFSKAVHQFITRKDDDGEAYLLLAFYLAGKGVELDTEDFMGQKPMDSLRKNGFRDVAERLERIRQARMEGMASKKRHAPNAGDLERKAHTPQLTRGQLPESKQARRSLPGLLS